MPTWAPFIAVTLLVQAPMFTLPADIDEPVAAAPCPAEQEARAEPRVRVGSTLMPRLRQEWKPSTPAAFIAANVGDAKVRVSTVVDTDGQTCDLRIVSSSHSGLGLEEASLDAVTQWRFHPARTDGSPVRQTVIIELHYSHGRPQPRSGDPAGADAKLVDPLLKGSRPWTTQTTPP